ncbi:hypothetical protein J6590_058815 [Homalodisca vitripennis]|nr:hypothetical protein J6590_058815 [Homalodisca vitripennis]
MALKDKCKGREKLESDVTLEVVLFTRLSKFHSRLKSFPTKKRVKNLVRNTIEPYSLSTTG